MHRFRKPWWGPSAWIMLAAVVAFVLVCARALWEEAHPCIEHGPSETTYVMQSCGDNCWMNTPITTRPCLRRK